jgi:hypothetical protein
MDTRLRRLWCVLGAVLLARAAVAQPAVGVNAFTGSGPNSQLGRGLSDMIVTDLANDAKFKKCGGVVVELTRRDEVLKEQKLCREHPELFDRSTCGKEGKLTQPTAVVDGTVTTTPDRTTWSIQMKDPATGKVIGGSHGSASGGLEDLTRASKTIAEQLVGQTCRVGMDYSSPPVAAAGSPSPLDKPSDIEKKAGDAVRKVKGLFGR